MKIFSRILLALLVCFIFNNTKALAGVTDYVPHKMTVQFEQDFSSTNPSEEFVITITDNYNFQNVRPIEKGTKLYLEVTKVSQEKMAKMSASVEARIVKAYIPSTDTTINVKNPKAIVKFSKYEKLDISDKAIDTGISVANHFVKNLTYPAQFVKGVAQNKEGDRLKSGFKEAYEASPLSYLEKGEPLELHSGDLATLTFYTKIKNNNPEETK